MTTKHTIIIKGKSYPYTLTKHNNGTTILTCKAALIDQEFADEDIVETISLLPEYVQMAQKKNARNDSIIRFRVSSSDRLAIEKKAKAAHKTVSGYLRDRALASSL